MSGLVLSSALFSGQPVWTEVDFGDGQTAEVLLSPIDGDLDSEYVKRRGLDEQTLSVRMRSRDDDEEPETGEFRARVEVEPISRTISNSREIAAAKWLCPKIVHGWRGFSLDTGNELEFSGASLAKLSGFGSFARPVIAAAYNLGVVKRSATEGN